MKISIARVLVVTLGLCLLGAVCGAVLGGIAFSLEFTSHWSELEPREWAAIFLSGGVFGAAFGFVLTPIVGWVFLRRVSLGRAIVQTAAGVLAGVVLGRLIGFAAAIPFGLCGFIVAGGILWCTTRPVKSSQHVKPTDACSCSTGCSGGDTGVNDRQHRDQSDNW